MPREAISSRLALVVALAGTAGCYSIDPAPLVSGAAYRFGVGERTFHRELPDIVTASQAAMADLGIKQIDENTYIGESQITGLTSDGRTVQLDLAWASGTPEGMPLPLRGTVTQARVRIGRKGDKDLSGKLFDRIATRLRDAGAPSALAPTPAPHQ